MSDLTPFTFDGIALRGGLNADGVPEIVAADLAAINLLPDERPSKGPAVPPHAVNVPTPREMVVDWLRDLGEDRSGIQNMALEAMEADARTIADLQERVAKLEALDADKWDFIHFERAQAQRKVDEIREHYRSLMERRERADQVLVEVGRRVFALPRTRKTARVADLTDGLPS